jgi:hypothetical protein
MSSSEAYLLFLLKVNKNDTNANVHISRAEFVKLFNEEQRRWLNEKLNAKLDTDEVNDLNELLVPFTALTRERTFDLYIEFLLPDDFFAIGSYYIIGRSGQCKRVLEPEWVNIKNIMALLTDEYSKPSFDFERTLVTFAANKLQVYTNGFDIAAAFVSYYRMPTDIDLAGYINEDGSASVNADPQLQDMYTEQIINRCVRHVIANYENPEGLQLREAIIKTEE